MAKNVRENVPGIDSVAPETCTSAEVTQTSTAFCPGGLKVHDKVSTTVPAGCATVIVALVKA